MSGGRAAAGVEVVREVVHGRWKAQALAAALRLGLADALGDRAVPLGELAAQVEADEDGLRRLLRLMVALGLFAEAGGDAYRNNEASQLLRADHPGSLRGYALRTLSTSYASGLRIE
jgi:C-methyltransferase